MWQDKSNQKSNIRCLAIIAVTQPHAAYSALTHGLMNKWTYLSRTIPDIGPQLRPLNDALRSALFTALTGRPPPSDLECKLFALPARLGALGLSIPSRSATLELHSSPLVTSVLCDHILSQDYEYGYEIIIKQQVCQQKNAKTSADAEEVCELLPASLRRAVDLAKEKGSLTWLTALPLVEYGFAPHSGAFHDAINVHLWKLSSQWNMIHQG